jgi:hypothetical protein
MIVSSHGNIRLHIQFDPDWPKWQTKRSKLAAKDFETSECLQDTLNRYLMLACVSAPISWNAISTLHLRWSYKALRDDLVLPSATTLRNIWCREYAMRVDAIKKQLPSRNKVSLALDGWTSRNKLAIMSVIAYYIDRNWALREFEPAFKEVDRLFFSCFERWLRMIDQEQTHWSNASCTFERCAGPIWAHWRPLAQYYDG